MPLNAHVMVQKVARNIAAELWEVYARDNATYHAMRAGGQITERQARNVFINQVAPKFYEQARQALVMMLEQPDENVPVSMKDQIAEALILDNPHRGNRLVTREQARIPRHLH